MKVFIVIFDDAESSGIGGVFSTRALADEYVASRPVPVCHNCGERHGGWVIRAYTVDAKAPR